MSLPQSNARLFSIPALLGSALLLLGFGGCPRPGADFNGADPNSVIAGIAETGGAGAVATWTADADGAGTSAEAGNADTGTSPASAGGALGGLGSSSNGPSDGDPAGSDDPGVPDLGVLTAPDTPIAIELRGTSPTGLPLEFAIVAPPVDGSLSQVEPVDDFAAAVTFTPPSGFRGQAQFSYQASDGSSESNVGTVIVLVYPPVYFDLDVTEGDAPLTVTGQAFTMTSDPLPDATYRWNWGDLEEGGPVESFGQRTHTFVKSGTYSVGLSLVLAGLSQPIACTHSREGKETQFAEVVVFVPGHLAVSPADGLTSTGFVGGPFDPNSKLYTLTNTGGAQLTWTATASQGWVTLSSTGGTLAAGASDAVVASLNANANALAPGSFGDTVTFANTANANDSTTRNVALTVNALPGVLAVDPNAPFSSAGSEGGPFQPDSTTYTLSNAGDQALIWTATSTQSWVSLSSESGTLQPGASTTVTVSINSGAGALPAGSYSDLVSFASPSERGHHARAVALDIAPPGKAIISGRVADGTGAPISGVTLSGLPGNPTTNATGNYSALVNDGFNGTVTPSKAGYNFSPANRTYTNVTADQINQDYTGTLQTFTISGRVTDGSAVAISGVTISGLPGNAVTNASGDYTATVSYGWSGTATPSKAGYSFSPASRSYANITANQTNQNYTGTLQTLTISGRVTDGSAVAISGVTISGLPGNPVTNASGDYSATVNYGFSGTATPGKAGYTFSPASRTYSNVTANQTSQNYTATLQTFTISGHVADGSGTAVSGVTISGLPGNPVTNASGDYTGTVNYGWSGAATPSKAGYTFAPASRTYSNVTANQTAQNYTGTSGGGLSLVPIARWDVVPYQRINAGETLNIGVVAFSKAGIDRVRFTISGQSYSGPNPIDVTAMSLNPQSNVWEYWTPIAANDFASDGQIAVEATVHGADGGLRDKSTGGGSLGLDTMTFTVNPGSTLTQAEAWVDTAGSDDTGVVGDVTHPFKSIKMAVSAIAAWNNSHGLGNTPQGGIVRLNAGTHSDNQQGGLWTTFGCASEWVTVTHAAGASSENTILAGSAYYNVAKMKFTGITISGAGRLDNTDWGYANAVVWVHDCALIGSGRWTLGSSPIGAWLAGYETNSSITAVDRATGAITTRLCRGLTITAIGEDAFQNAPLVVNCTADDVNPHLSTIGDIADATYTAHGHASGHDYVIEKAGAFTNYTQAATRYWDHNYSYNVSYPIAGKISDDAIWLSTGISGAPATTSGRVSTNWHSDAYQLGSGAGDNFIIYGYRATHVYDGGLQVRGVTPGQPAPAPAAGIALVNVYMSMAGTSAWNGWYRCVDHLIWWHVTVPNLALYLLDDPGASDIDPLPLVLTSLSAKGNAFYRLSNASATWTPATVDWDQNHYVVSAGSITPGTNITTGPALLDSYGRPDVGSPLIGRVAPSLVPVDQSNWVRQSPSDIGAYEH